MAMTSLKAFTMPKWGIEMSEGTIAEWKVAEGEPFSRGTLLALIETDKITNDVEAESDGCFMRLVATAGETYAVGALLAVFGTPGTDAASIDAFVRNFKATDTAFSGSDADSTASTQNIGEAIADDAHISPAARQAAIAAGLDIAQISGSGRDARITLQDVHQATRQQPTNTLKGVYIASTSQVYASPIAKRLAAINGVDLEKLSGTGPRGRIAKQDVLAAVASAAPVSPVIEPMSKMRKAIARRLTESKTTIPHFYVRRRVRADRLIKLRDSANPKPSLNDYLIRACALALIEVPALNIQVHGQDIHRFKTADIAVAVATDGGLITPIVTAAEQLSIGDIGAKMRDMADRARAGKLKQQEFDGGSFSISNLGMHGVEQFDAIINPPQGAILAVGAARPEPVDDDGAIRILPVFHLSLSCDHRAIDGADAGRFMVALADLIEHPEAL
jgi:pyruvate dehydrogenase E2 component (dihydrolipoamide acetyltransferase)